jgi:hypothetical protein
METKGITIYVDVETAKVYESTLENRRKMIDALLNLRLKELTSPPRPIGEVMSEISREAQERGLTPKILDEILAES